MNIETIMTCLREKTIKTPKVIKILQIAQTTLAWVQEVCLPDSLIYDLHCKQSCKARLKIDLV